VGGGDYGTNGSACYVWHRSVDALSFVHFPDGGMVTCIKAGYPPALPPCPTGYAEHAAGSWTADGPPHWPPLPQAPDHQNGTMALCAAKCTAASCVAFLVGGGAYGTNASECRIWGSVNPLDWTPRPAGALAMTKTCMRAGYHPSPPPKLHDLKMLTAYGGTPDQLHGMANVFTADCCGGQHDACRNSTITSRLGMKIMANVENQTGPCGGALSSFLGNIWSRGNGYGCKSPKGLCPDWEAYLTAYIAHMKPLVDSGKIFGIFLGDELVCSGIPYADLSKVAGRLKAAMPKAWVYLNECGDVVGNMFPPIAADGTGGVPPGLDAISIDAYSQGIHTHTHPLHADSFHSDPLTHSSIQTLCLSHSSSSCRSGCNDWGDHATLRCVAGTSRYVGGGGQPRTLPQPDLSQAPPSSARRRHPRSVRDELQRAPGE
jgi:hypothetical protein